MSEYRVAVVTGVSSGIGRFIAVALVARGYRVYGTVRTKKPDSAIEGVTLVTMDVLDDKSVREAIQTVATTEGRIDVLVNNAGINLVGAVEETSVAEAQLVFETNFFGVVRVTQAALPVMRNQGSGRILNIGSVVGFLPTPYWAYYGSSKHALEGYTESLDHEIRNFGIRAMVIEPGYVQTNIGTNTLAVKHNLAAYGATRQRAEQAIQDGIRNGSEPEAIVEVVLQALDAKKPKPRYQAGRGASTLFRIRRWLPWFVFEVGIRKSYSLDA